MWLVDGKLSTQVDDMFFEWPYQGCVIHHLAYVEYLGQFHIPLAVQHNGSPHLTSVSNPPERRANIQIHSNLYIAGGSHLHTSIHV